MPLRFRTIKLSLVLRATLIGFAVCIIGCGCGQRTESSPPPAPRTGTTAGPSSGPAGMTPEAQAQMHSAQQAGAAMRAAHSAAPGK